MISRPYPFFTASFLATLFLFACKKENEEPVITPPQPKLIFKFSFDSTQIRLNGFGQPQDVPAGHAAQSPDFNTISAHYLELVPSMMTPLGSGYVLYNGAQTTAGGSAAIDFAQSTLVAPGQTFQEYKLSDLAPGTYPYLRVSLAYQNYDIAFRANGADWNATVASFVGFNTYITDYTIQTQQQSVNANKLQGYWGVEADIWGTPYVVTGQAPEGATTVPNPLFDTAPIPQGSCVVTGIFAVPLVITGSETEDVVVTLSLSSNQSFEWVDVVADGLYEPSAGESVVDMGIRGLIPVVD